MESSSRLSELSRILLDDVLQSAQLLIVVGTFNFAIWVDEESCFLKQFLKHKLTDCLHSISWQLVFDEMTSCSSKWRDLSFPILSHSTHSFTQTIEHFISSFTNCLINQLTLNAQILILSSNLADLASALLTTPPGKTNEFGMNEAALPLRSIRIRFDWRLTRITAAASFQTLTVVIAQRWNEKK